MGVARRISRALALGCLIALAPQAARADEGTAARQYAIAQHDEPSLLAFLQGFPKGADLHNHLNGALRWEDLVDSAIAHKLSYDPARQKFTKDPAPGFVSAQAMAEDGSMLAAFGHAASMSAPRPGVSGHDQFFSAFEYIGSVTHFMPLEERVALVALEARRENLRYLELMANPASGAMHGLDSQAYKAQDLEGSLRAMAPSIDQYVRAGVAEAERADREVAKRLGYSGRASDADSPVTVRYVFQVDRTSSDADFFMQAAAGLALVKAAPQVVAIDVVAPEDDPVARTHFQSQLRLLDFLWKRYNQPAISLHAGELTPACSPLEPLQTHIRQSVELGHARRIGHGVALGWDPDAAGLLAEMRQKHVALELCLSSNDAILGVKGFAHPVHLYRRAGVPLVVCTDDEGITRTNLTLEYAKLVRTVGPSYVELKDDSRNGLEYAFVEGNGLYLDHDYRRLRPGFEGVRGETWQPGPSAAKQLLGSPKLRLQVRLERDIVAFERRFGASPAPRHHRQVDRPVTVDREAVKAAIAKSLAAQSSPALHFVISGIQQDGRFVRASILSPKIGPAVFLRWDGGEWRVLTGSEPAALERQGVPRSLIRGGA